MLGDEFGLGALGVIQCLLGAAVLSHHVDEFSLVSAFFLFSLGCLNIFLGLVFREKAKPRRALASWNETEEVLPHTSLRSGPRPFLTAVQTGSSSSTMWEEKGAEATRSGTQKSGMGFGRQGEKAALARGATLTRPQEALPTYVPRPTAPSPAPTYISRTVRYANSEHEAETDTGARPVSAVSYEEDSGTPRAV